MKDERIGRWYLTTYARVRVRIESFTERACVRVWMPKTKATLLKQISAIDLEHPQEMAPDELEHWRNVQDNDNRGDE